jgi:phage baseplate assembly protein W
MENIALPLVLRDGYLRRASLHDSISYSIALILSTHLGQMPFDPEFGCVIWDKEYSDIYSADKAEIRASIRNSIGKYEKRLYDVSVSFSVADPTAVKTLGIVVKIKGLYRDGKEEQKFESIYNLG